MARQACLRSGKKVKNITLENCPLGTYRKCTTTPIVARPAPDSPPDLSQSQSHSLLSEYVPQDTSVLTRIEHEVLEQYCDGLRYILGIYATEREAM